MVTGGAFRLVLLLSPLVLSCRASDDELTFEQLFTEGKRAYSQKQWYDCVAFLRRAVEDFNHYNSEVLWCRENCERQIPASNVTGMAEIHRTAQRALCLFRCKTERLSASRPIHRRHLLWFDMEERLPYRFMHICYWHLKDLSNAVKAAFTYLVRNPGHEETLENIEFYSTQEGFKSEMLIDLQQKQYEALYMEGVNAYSTGDWFGCKDKLEQSLQQVLEEDRRCRLDCQDKLDWSSVEGTLEMDIIATSMRASVLRCESSCLGRLAWVNGHNVGNIIASHFEYLHICQYETMRGTDACASVANYLLFDDSIAMRRNKFVYLKKYDRADLFTPTEEMLALHRRVMLEKRLLSFIDREFKVTKIDEFLAHAGNDRARWDEYVDLEDKFPYDKVETLLGPGECKVLRAPIRTRVTDLLIEELAESVRQNLGLALSDKHEAHVSCSSVFLEAHCPRPLVLSVDEKTCSQWLPPIHSGCSIVFCIA